MSLSSTKLEEEEKEKKKRVGGRRGVGGGGTRITINRQACLEGFKGGSFGSAFFVCN